MPENMSGKRRAQFEIFLMISVLSWLVLFVPDSAAVDPCALNPQSYELLNLDHANPNVVKRLQLELRDSGFNPDEIDGIVGPNTRAAIVSFQREQQLEPNGTFDQSTVDALLGTTTREVLFPSRAEHQRSQDAYIEYMSKLCLGSYAIGRDPLRPVPKPVTKTK